ncbi:MAG TPA: hypothetical protein VF654_05470 [Pyrinomonadaceae bacterium]|jgi:predicted phosphoribosyltransferase
MVKEKLDELFCAALDQLMRALFALREMAWLNRRMTARGLVLAVAFVAARLGFEISPATQATLGTLFILYLGVVGRDRHRKSL